MSHSSVPKMYISAGCSGADAWVILKKWRQEGQEFETSLNYALNAHFNHCTLLVTLSQHPQGPFYSASELRSGGGGGGGACHPGFTKYLELQGA